MTSGTKPFIEWTPALSVRVEAMDEEHRMLINLMNALYDYNAMGADRDTILRAFDALATFTGKHFADEEAYMESVGYAHLESHKQAHRQLLACVDMQRREFAGGGGKVASAVFTFFRNWLTTHILGVDFRYGRQPRKTDPPKKV